MVRFLVEVAGADLFAQAHNLSGTAKEHALRLKHLRIYAYLEEKEKEKEREKEREKEDRLRASGWSVEDLERAIDP